MTTNLYELKKEIEKTLEAKLKKGNKKLFFVGLSLGLILTSAASVIAVSTIGNHDHFISQILGSDKERINLDTKKLNAIDCVRSNAKASDDNSSINSAANCWEISTRTSAPTNFVGDVTYIDLRTGFMWSSMFSDTDGINLADSLTNCDGASIRGFTDWRLPTISELKEAFDHGYYEVAAGTDEDGDGVLTDNWDNDADGSIADASLWSATANNAVITASFLYDITGQGGSGGGSIGSDTDTNATGGMGGAESIYSARCVRTAR